MHEDIWCLSLHFTAKFTVATLSEQKEFVEICIRRCRFDAFMKILSFCLTSIIVRPHADYRPCLLCAIEIHFGVKILCNFMQIASGMRCSAFAEFDKRNVDVSEVAYRSLVSNSVLGHDFFLNIIMTSIS